jgi:hypothetical protein
VGLSFCLKVLYDPVNGYNISFVDRFIYPPDVA